MFWFLIVSNHSILDAKGIKNTQTEVWMERREHLRRPVSVASETLRAHKMRSKLFRGIYYSLPD